VAHRMKNFKITEISTVGRPAQEGADVLFVKRSDELPTPRDGESAEQFVKRFMSDPAVVDKLEPDQRGAAAAEQLGFDKNQANLVLTSDSSGHSHLLDLSENGGVTTHVRMKASDEMGHSHPWVRDSEGTITIGAALGHTHDALMMKSAGEEPDGNEPAEGGLKKGSHKMSDKTTATAAVIGLSSG